MQEEEILLARSSRPVSLAPEPGGDTAQEGHRGGGGAQGGTRGCSIMQEVADTLTSHNDALSAGLSAWPPPVALWDFRDKGFWDWPGLPAPRPVMYNTKGRLVQ